MQKDNTPLFWETKEGLVVIVLAFLLFIFFNNYEKISEFFSDVAETPLTGEVYLPLLVVFGIFLIVSFAIIYYGYYFFAKHKKLTKKNREEFLKRVEENSMKAENRMVRRWNRIEKLATSESENDWKAAIIDADILLEDSFVKNGIAGESVGDMLNSPETRHLATIRIAKQAHRVRNLIAHRGEIRLNREQVGKTIGDYKAILREIGTLD
ncbi:MAG: hypothetical protein OXU73_02840 [Candidatus Campbellbacteria bacterium]|nr:hypothetical protein [Candidatus Campbellbacteria bacterium]